MCWRIVRISGDGSIKLILEDQDELCSETMNGNWNISITTGGTVRKENIGYTEYESTSSNEIKYIMNYLIGTRNYNISMETAFENFQTGPLLNYLSYLKSGDWCLGNVGYVSSTDNSLPLTIQELKDKQNNIMVHHFIMTHMYVYMVNH